jgi:dienelactone hydrolase
MIVRGMKDALTAAGAALVVLAVGSCGVQVGTVSHMERWHRRPLPAAAVSARSAAVSARNAAVSARSAAASERPVAVSGVPGEYRVGLRELTFREPSAGGARTLVTEIRYPAGAAGSGPFPLLVFAPGFQQCGAPYGDLLRTWASAGYVVATVDFPRTDCRVGAAADEADLIHQPADMSYVMGKLLALSAGRGDPLTGMLDPREIAAAGQSDGGDTVAALAASSCCADHRLDAAAVLSGAEWPQLPGRYFTGRTPPMLFTQGSADAINPPWTSVQMYTSDRSQARYYLDLPGAGHTTPYWGDGPAERLVARETVAFFDHYVLGQPAGLPAVAGLVSGGRLPPG